MQLVNAIYNADHGGSKDESDVHRKLKGKCNRKSNCLVSVWQISLQMIIIRKVMGVGNFRAAGIFFRYQNPCMNLF